MLHGINKQVKCEPRTSVGRGYYCDRSQKKTSIRTKCDDKKKRFLSNRLRYMCVYICIHVFFLFLIKSLSESEFIENRVMKATGSNEKNCE